VRSRWSILSRRKKATEPLNAKKKDQSDWSFFFEAMIGLSSC
jgi:hypothetical protein